MHNHSMPYMRNIGLVRHVGPPSHPMQSEGAWKVVTFTLAFQRLFQSQEDYLASNIRRGPKPIR